MKKRVFIYSSVILTILFFMSFSSSLETSQWETGGNYTITINVNLTPFTIGLIIMGIIIVTGVVWVFYFLSQAGGG